MKLNNLFKSLLLSLTFVTCVVTAAHHEETGINYKEGQQAVMDAFGWDFDQAEISTE